MEENEISLKPISEFLKPGEYSFLVKSYQRGYKWTSKEVKDLLNDIHEFNGENDSFYCLQPVVVRKEKGDWELIDGQQRFTTVYLVLSFLKEERFNIEYQTRKTSSEFLKRFIGQNNVPNLSWKDFADNNASLNNIDNYHFFEAYRAVNEWFTENKGVDKALLLAKLKDKAKVIWYEVKDSGAKSEEIFSRINSGKIPLTNSELIKALFLTQKKQEAASERGLLQYQTELAQEWDRIEYELQKDGFWYFINEKVNEQPTRIEFIFDLISKKQKKQDAFFSFTYYCEELKKRSVEELWREVKNYFLTLQEWYEDNELFHYIGYLIASGSSNINQLKASFEKESKKAFKQNLRGLIWESLQGNEIDDLKYPGHNQLITRVLLLFNIQTLLSSDKNIRFQFDRLKLSKWSLEHIHAQQSKGLNTKEQWLAWLEQYLEMLNGSDLAVRVRECIASGSISSELFNELQNEIFVYFGRTSQEQMQEDINNISNLTLLDSGTNSLLSNHLFPVKRNRIIEQDKLGKFIPICTKNVFLKYYSKNPAALHFWGEQDRIDYLEEIKKTLKVFHPQQSK